ncbi:hypothetical protein BJ964_007752 [Actinoplanes lobatus]|uniref:Uncharacterized protein n=1 Tax=Actinoplanes lobatus TaxID=113568 RepID=A0A7W7HN49_9ACTN|nr:hypothetical protein [Actinoplanes lobatus]
MRTWLGLLCRAVAVLAGLALLMYAGLWVVEHF